MLSIRDAYICVQMLKKYLWLLGVIGPSTQMFLYTGNVTFHKVDAEGLEWSGPLVLAVEHMEKSFINGPQWD